MKFFLWQCPWLIVWCRVCLKINQICWLAERNSKGAEASSVLGTCLHWQKEKLEGQILRHYVSNYCFNVFLKLNILTGKILRHSAYILNMIKSEIKDFRPLGFVKLFCSFCEMVQNGLRNNSFQFHRPPQKSESESCIAKVIVHWVLYIAEHADQARHCFGDKDRYALTNPVQIWFYVFAFCL